MARITVRFTVALKGFDTDDVVEFEGAPEDLDVLRQSVGGFFEVLDG